MTRDQETQLLDILARTREITLATNRPDGWPQATVVNFVSEGLTLYICIDAYAQKAANIDLDGRVSVTATAPYSRWQEIRGLSLAGDAWFLTAPDDIARVVGWMDLRYGADVARLRRHTMREPRIVRIRPHIISLIDYSRGYGHKTDLVPPPAGGRRASAA